MKATLYKQVREIESIDEKLKGLDSSSEIDVSELQRNLFRRYEENPVLYDAIQGKQTIGESIEELDKINKGIRRILPWRKNKSHNERLKQLGELVSEPYQLHTYGIFMPNNLITVGAMVMGITYLTSFPRAASALIVSLTGLVFTLARYQSLPRNEAKYLDGKVIEFYK